MATPPIRADASPDVSVIIPVHDRHRQVIDAVRSALAQEEVNVEIIVVDDGSTPPIDLDSLKDGRVRVVRHERNRGAAAARNTGIAVATGRYVAFLDSDDTWMPDKLSRQLAAASVAPELSVIATGWRYRFDDRLGDEEFIPEGAKGIHAFAGGVWFGPGSTALISRSVVDLIGPQDESLARLEDYDWFLRFALAGGELIIVAAALTAISWRRHTDWRDVDVACRHMRQKYDRRDRAELSVAAWRRIRARLLLSRASTRWYAGRKLAALWLLAGSWAFWPRTHLLLIRPARRTDD
jgi:glycosyltransferase involved in cell wall biosynthesis